MDPPTSWDLVFTEKERLKSFKYWCYKDGPCSAEKMAEAGFHTTGKKSDSQLAQCYVCFKELDGWEEDDDPWSEHKKHSPNCLFVRIGKKCANLSIEEMLKLEIERMKNFVMKKYQDQKNILEQAKAAVDEELKRISINENKENQKGRSTSSTVKRSSRRK